jgi:pimeloyl-ACP methyl ester carboxylesterase
MQKIIYLPGWLNKADTLGPLAELVGGDFSLIDLTESAPDKVMSVADFANQVISKMTAPAYLVGHSFGGKVAIAAAALHPEKVLGIFVIAGSNRGKWIYRLLRPMIKLAGRAGFDGERFQAPDYKNLSLVMKKIMQKTLDFDIIPMARRVECPATFIYGASDTVTPPRLGGRLAAAARGQFFILKGFNHNSIVMDGIYQVGAIIRNKISQA